MPEKNEKKPEEKPAAAATPAAAPVAPGDEKKGCGMLGLLKSTPTLLGVVMVMEAAILFAGFKLMGSTAKNAHGTELVTTDSHGAASAHGEGGTGTGKVAEVEVLKFKAPNKLTGRTVLYDVQIFVTVKPEFKDRVKGAIDERDASIKHRIRTIIAQTDPEKLGGGSEPGLETLRRQVKTQLDELIGEGLIEEVLVPHCIPYRAEY